MYLYPVSEILVASAVNKIVNFPDTSYVKGIAAIQ